MLGISLYCIKLRSMVLYLIVLFGITWYCISFALYSISLQGVEYHFIILYGIACHCIVFDFIALYCMLFH